jgi:hypothetical protein
MRPEQRQRVRHAISFFYDMQKLRIQAGNRASGQSEDSEIQLDEADITFFQKQSSGLNELERGALGYVERQLKGIPIYEQWLKKQAGCGPTMGGFLISEIDIRRCETVSQLWAYFGLAVDDDGHAQRRVKGEKSGFDPWRKSKVVSVLGECLLKASGARTKKLRIAAIEATLGKEYLSSVAYRDLIEKKFPELKQSDRMTKGVTKVTNEFLEAVVEEHDIYVESAGGWTKFYDDYKHRKSSEMHPVCANCDEGRQEGNGRQDPRPTRQVQQLQRYRRTGTLGTRTSSSPCSSQTQDGKSVLGRTLGYLASARGSTHARVLRRALPRYGAWKPRPRPRTRPCRRPAPP